MKKLSIHTATYNRAYILSNAYESLKKQTVKDFEWLITDDGSTDGTEALVNGWMSKDNGFDIIYNKLDHVGIPRALNSGVNKVNTEWFMLLDSDDYLFENAVECVLNWLEEIKDDMSFAGVGFARCFPDGKFMKNQIPKIDPYIGYVDATNVERQKYNLDMDMCEAYRVKYLKQYPFECWEDEKFAPEQLGFNKMAFAGLKLRWRADKLYVCDYLEDGLTKSDRLVKNNPMGFVMMHNQNLLIDKNLKNSCYTICQMIALLYYKGNLKYIKNSNRKLLTIALLPFGIALGIRRKMQYKKLS